MKLVSGTTLGPFGDIGFVTSSSRKSLLASEKSYSSRRVLMLEGGLSSSVLASAVSEPVQVLLTVR